jgi:hypothetical protein
LTLLEIRVKILTGLGKELAIVLRFFLIISLLVFFYPKHVKAVITDYHEDEQKAGTEQKKQKATDVMTIESLIETETIIIGEGRFQIIKPKIRIDEETMKILKGLKEAEKSLKSLVKERETLVGDFWGINITARRYDNIFDRRNYIRYKIVQTDKEIQKTKLKISNLKKELNTIKKLSAIRRGER